MNSFELRMECIRIASDTSKSTDVSALLADAMMIEEYLTGGAPETKPVTTRQVLVEAEAEPSPTEEERRDDIVAELLATIKLDDVRQVMAEMLADVSADNAKTAFERYLPKIMENLHPEEEPDDVMSEDSLADVLNLASSGEMAEEEDEPAKPKGRKKVEEILEERKKAEEKEAQAVEEVLSADEDPERKSIMDELVAELDPTDRIVMRKLLQKVDTKHLKPAFKQYLSRVLNANKD